MEERQNKEKGDNTDVYEAGFLISPVITEEKIEEEVGSIKSLLEEEGATIIDEGKPSYIELAYPMRSETEKGNQVFTKGYFDWIKFESTDGPEAIDAKLKENANLLRHIVISTVRESTFTSPAERESERERETVIADSFGGSEGDDSHDKKQKSAVKVEEKRDLSEGEEKEIDDAIEELVE